MNDRPPCDRSAVAAWFAGRLPAWFVEPPVVRVDREEILVIGTLPAPAELPEDEAARRGAIEAFVDGFRERTRDERVVVAGEAQLRWQRQVSWGAAVGDFEHRFTTASVPIMTRLRFDERAVLDTLVDAGVARSRAEALAWCVRLVGQHEGDWLGRLREAMTAVEHVRSERT